ncbi:hypothetical protein F4802DRAFT_579540 [Xylaria palmicola]|nr:hypothetical protein F4802DRAFT_579540 [Xylaria palmicola]
MHLAQPPESFGDDLDHHSNAFPMTSDSPPAYDDHADDVFGAGSDAPHGSADSVDMLLDTRRLRAQHNTVGYREGITAGKAGSIQAGFDQGFALGAHVGARAGRVLGLLEGIDAALADAGPADERERLRAGDLLSRAAAELTPAGLFTAKFWAADGTWTYPVAPSRPGGEVVYPDVADQHPLILKWARIARDEAARWHVDQELSILEDDDDEPSARGDSAAPDAVSKPDITSRDAIEW